MLIISNKTMRQSAGVLLYKYVHKSLEVFLVHPGGPFWKNKDTGAWSIPKGEFIAEENALDAAVREFKEETGTAISGNFMALSPVRLKSGKIVHAWALEGFIDASQLNCETFIKLEWPPRSGKFQSFPEIDRGEWFTPEEAKKRINPAQIPLIDELIQKVNAEV